MIFIKENLAKIYTVNTIAVLFLDFSLEVYEEHTASEIMYNLTIKTYRGNKYSIDCL